ncbi:MAG: lamin tail domain-containing protein [Pirellulales bacterium]|nr:lamin tail domain-containing protein [Pirellulales bacterium]
MKFRRVFFAIGLIACGTVCSVVDANTIAITEFLSNPDGSDGVREWIEIFNYGSSSVVLDGWTLEDEDSNLGTIGSLTLQPGAYAIIADDKTTFQDEWLGGNADSRVIELDTGSFGLTNTSDEIALKNAGTTVWSLAYGTGPTEGHSAFLTPNFDQFATTSYGNKATPGVDTNGNDSPGFLGYEGNNFETDGFLQVSTGGDEGSPLMGNYTAAPFLPSEGSIAFVGFNADGTDDFAIVVLEDLKKGTVIHFTDKEWTGASFNSSEDTLTWTLTEDVDAGTVVNFNDLVNDVNDAPAPSAGPHVLIYDGAAMSLSGSGEAIYAFIGQDNTTPTTFLAAISTDLDVYDGTDGTLTGTGLVQGLTAILLPNADDIAEYVGPRSGFSSFADYLAAIGNVDGNWITQDASGDQSSDENAPDTPFNASPFSTLAAVPEPSALALAVLSVLALTTLSRRRRAI